MTSAKLHWSVVDRVVCMAVFRLIALAAHPYRLTPHIAGRFDAYLLTNQTVKQPSIATILVAI